MSHGLTVLGTPDDAQHTGVLLNSLVPSAESVGHMNLSVTGKAKSIVFKVAKWDPDKHPRGYKGMFEDTPDKKPATEAAVGDVIASKSGKVFKVEKQTEKGVKVNPVDPDTGEVKESFTVLPNDVQIAVFDKGKPPGSVHPITDLEPDTYVQHPNSGKRFKISKHGKWTTVYPVDNQGNVTGKHTVLPPNTQMIVSTPNVTDHASEAQADALEVIKAEKPKEPDHLHYEMSDLINYHAGVQASPGHAAYTLPNDLDAFAGLQEDSHVSDEEYWEWYKAKFSTNYLKDPTEQQSKDFKEAVAVLRVKHDQDLKDYAAELIAWKKAQKGELTPPEPLKDQFLSYLEKEFGFDQALVESSYSLLEVESLGKDVGVWTQFFTEMYETVMDKPPEQAILDGVEGRLTKILQDHEAQEQAYNAHIDAQTKPKGDIPPIDSGFLMDKKIAAARAVMKQITAWPVAAQYHSTSAELRELIEAAETNEEYTVMVNSFGVEMEQLAAVGIFKGAMDAATLEAENEWAAKHAGKKWKPQPGLMPKEPESSLDQIVDGARVTLDDAGITNGNLSNAFINKYLGNYSTDGEEAHYPADDDDWSHWFQTFIDATEGDHSKEDEVAAINDFIDKKTVIQVKHDQEVQAYIKEYDEWSKAVMDSTEKPEFPLAAADSLGKAIEFEENKAIFWGDGMRWVKEWTDAGMPNLNDINEAKVWYIKAFENIALDSPVDSLPFDDVAGISMHSASTTHIHAFERMWEPEVQKAQDAAVDYHKREKLWKKGEQRRKAGSMLDDDEQLPSKLPKTPKKYPPGVGVDTVIVIEEGAGPRLHPDGNYKSDVNHLLVKRVPADNLDAPGQVIGIYGAVGDALRVARDQPAHEAIIRRDVAFDKDKQNTLDPKVGDVYAHPGGVLLEIAEVEDWADSDGKVWKRVKNKKWGDPNTPTGSWVVVGNRDPWVKIDPEDDAVKQALFVAESVQILADINDKFKVTMPQGWWREQAIKDGLVSYMDKDIRGAHPEKYIAELRDEWDYSELHGAKTNEALKTLGKLGFREIRPRKEKNPKLINERGTRLHLITEGGSVTAINEQKSIYDISTQSARAFYDQLEEAITTEGDLTELDPRQDGNLEARNSQTRQILYDLAVGKVNGVQPTHEVKGKKVKSDEAYRTEIEAAQMSSEQSVASKQEYHDSVQDEFDQNVPIKIKVPGAVITKWDMEDSPLWDFPNRELTIPTDKRLDPGLDYILALSRQGMTDIMKGDNDKAAPNLVVGDSMDIFEAAHHLRTEHLKDGSFSTAWSAELDPESAQYAKEAIKAAQSTSTEMRNERNSRIAERANADYEIDMKDEIAKRRENEGTVAEDPSGPKPSFTLPTWDELEFEPQTLSDIDTNIAEIGDRPVDVPIFFTGGALKDGVAQVQDKHLYAEVVQELDGVVAERLEAAGAYQTVNSDDLSANASLNYSGSGEPYPGHMLLLEESSAGDTEDAQIDAMKKVAEDRLKKAFWGGTQAAQAEPKSWIKAPMETLEDASFGLDPDEYEKQAFFIVQAALNKAFEADKINSTNITTLKDDLKASRIGHSIKKIEYVQHDQEGDLKPDYKGLTTGAASSQRGQLRVYGYSTEEAIDKLNELGIAHSLEPEVPLKAILRSDRRHGRVMPLHPDYLQGKSGPPKPPAKLVHGVVGGLDDMLKVIESGVLLPIRERLRKGVVSNASTSLKGDVRSGIDGGVFSLLYGSHWGNLKVVYKDDVFMRRDIILSTEDYGGTGSRYAAYANHHNDVRAAVGDEKANLYEPLSAKARQWHLDNDVPIGGGSAEWNPVGGARVEDWETIVATSLMNKEKIEAKLQEMYDAGIIGEIPNVEVSMPTTTYDYPANAIEGTVGEGQSI